MSDTTKLVDLTTFQWSKPSAEDPRLAAPITKTATTITVTNAPKDEDETIITGNFLMGIRNTAGYTETVYVPAAGVSADGLTFTACIRGVSTAGLDYNTAVTALQAAHETDSPVFCNVSAVNFQMMVSSMQGAIDSGAENWKIGNQADNDITIYAANGDGNEPFWRYDSATSAFVYSNDGVSSTAFGTGAGVTGGDGITVTAGDIDIDTTETSVFVKTSSGAGDEDKVIALNSSGQAAAGFIDLSTATLKSTLTTKGDIYGASAASTPARLGVGTNGQPLVADSSTATGLAYGDIVGVGNLGLPSNRYSCQISADYFGGDAPASAIGQYVQMVNDSTDKTNRFHYGGGLPAHFMPSQGLTVTEARFDGWLYVTGTVAVDVDVHFGLSVPADYDVAYTADNGDFIGFAIDGSGSKLYAKTVGTGVLTTDLGAVANSTWYQLSVIATAASVKFYLDKSLVATMSTDLPSLTTLEYYLTSSKEVSAVAGNHQFNTTGNSMSLLAT